MCKGREEEDSCYHDLWIGHQFPTWAENTTQRNAAVCLELRGFFFSQDGKNKREKVNKSQLNYRQWWIHDKKRGSCQIDETPGGPLCLHFPLCPLHRLYLWHSSQSLNDSPHSEVLRTWLCTGRRRRKRRRRRRKRRKRERQQILLNHSRQQCVW